MHNVFQELADDVNELDVDDSWADCEPIKAIEASHMLLELEKFFIANGMLENAEWANERFKLTKELANKSLKQASITRFSEILNSRVAYFCSRNIQN